MKKLLSIPNDWSNLSDDEVIGYIEYIKNHLMLFKVEKQGDVITLSCFGKIIKIEALHEYEYDYRFAINGKIIKEKPLWDNVRSFYHDYAWERVIWGRFHQIPSEYILYAGVTVVCVCFCVGSRLAFPSVADYEKSKNARWVEYEKARIKARAANNSPDTCYYNAR